MQIRYDALDNYREVEDRCRSQSFGELRNPVDGVEYPNIADVPADISEAVHRVHEQLLGPCTATFQFLRATMEDDSPPHRVHTDTSMGAFTSLLYLCDEGYTGIHTHKSFGFNCDPRTQEELEAWQNDTNDLEAWHTDFLIPAQRNKLVIYPANWLHSASDGYGRDLGSSRMVLTTFLQA